MRGKRIILGILFLMVILGNVLEIYGHVFVQEPLFKKIFLILFRLLIASWFGYFFYGNLIKKNH